MDLIKFDDYLIVERSTGEYDVWDNPVTETVFDGYGRYQQGGQVYTGFLVRNSVLFLPKDVSLNENDEVFVTLTNGRRLRGVVGTIRNIDMPLTHDRFTRLELKQVTDAPLQKSADEAPEDGGNENPDEGNVELPED